MQGPVTSSSSGSQRWLGRSCRSSLIFTQFLSLSRRSEKCFSEIFGLEYLDGTYDDALKRWFELGIIEMAPENEIQKIGQSHFLTANQRT